MTTTRRSGERGQGVAEFAIVLPVFLVLVFAIVDMGRVIWAYDSVTNAAREAARYASVHGDNEDVISCPTGPGLSPSLYVSGCPAWNPDSKAPTRAAARNYLVAAGTNIVIKVCYYATTACSGEADQAGATNGRGAFVTVTVTSQVPIITASLLGFDGFGVAATSTAIINN